MVWSEKAAMQRSALSIPNRTWLRKGSRTHSYTSRLVNVPAGYDFHAKVQVEVSNVQLERQERAQTGSVVACWHGDQVTGVCMST